MKFATIVLTALAVVVTTSAAEVGAPARRAVGVELEARECDPSPACTCTGQQGQFCGDESTVDGCLSGYVYECNGNTGQTCVYGIRDTCVRCGHLEC